MMALPCMVRHRSTVGIRSNVAPSFWGFVTTLVVFMLCPLWSSAQALPLPNSLLIDRMGTILYYPNGWSVAPKRSVNRMELINVPDGQQGTIMETARIKIGMQTMIDHADALKVLSEIASEVSSPSTFRLIDGWPGLQRRHLQRRPQPSTGPLSADALVLKATTAVAFENQLLRLEADMPENADAALIEEVEAIGQGLIFPTGGNPVLGQQELEDLRRRQRSPSLPLAPSSGSANSSKIPVLSASLVEGALLTGNAGNAVGTIQRVFSGGNGEIEVSASADAANIVLVRQSSFTSSNDGGQTFPFSGNFPFRFGDSSVAFGTSGSFYVSGIADAAGCTGGDSPRGCAIGVMQSTDRGQTFRLLGNAVACSTEGNQRCFPDQPHIGADRVNVASVSGGDQIYVVWRDFNSVGVDPMIACSKDSGGTWTAPADIDTNGDFSRISVGEDGAIYVIYRSGNNIKIQKFSSCESGLTPEAGFPKTVAEVSDVECPVPGLDRCNNGNSLSSHMAAVDDTNANHVYVAYATRTGVGNENVVVRDSIDGGATWPAGRVVILNSAVPARRFMPWVCTTNGEALVTWYDRRASTSDQNDVADYYGGSARLDGTGNLVAGTELKISSVSDLHCASGWPGGTRDRDDSESCSVQPQLAGFCCDNTQPDCPGSQQRCDFTSTTCPAAETCNTRRGSPKYGDYNGNACAGGRLFASWASATPPLGISSSGQIDVFFAGVGTFNLVTFPLTAAKAGTGTGTVTSNPAGITCGTDCLESYPSGTAVTLTATATTGSTFVDWSGCDSTAGASCTVTVSAARRVTATFNAQSYSSEITAHWKLDEGIGQTAADSVGDHDGILVNEPVWTTGIVGSALSFNGVNDYVYTTAFAQQGRGTIVSWFLAKRWDGSAGGVIASRSSNGYENGDLIIYTVYNHQHSTTDLSALVWGSGGWQIVRGPISPGQWNHFAFTWDGTTGKRLYLNGVLVDEIGNTDPVFHDLPITLGVQGHSQGYRYFDGIIDEVQVYRRALTSDEVWRDYQNVSVPEPSPTANAQTVTTAEDTPIAITLTGSDLDGDPLTFLIVRRPAHGTLAWTGADRTYTPRRNFNGRDRFTFTVSDGHATSAPATVVIDVTPVNNAPFFHPIADRAVRANTSRGTVLITGVSPGPRDERRQAVTMSATSSNPALIPHPTISGTGATRRLMFRPAPRTTGTATITVTADDGQPTHNTFQRTFTITVTPVADVTVPVFNGLSSATALSPSQIALTWAPASDNATNPGEIVYEVCRSQAPGQCVASFVATHTTQGATSRTIGSLAPGRTYFFVVRARDLAGNRDANTVERSATTRR